MSKKGRQRLFAVLPLIGRDSLLAKAEEIALAVRKRGIAAVVVTAKALVRRIQEQESSGTDVCLIVDDETLLNGTVVVRKRGKYEKTRPTVSSVLRRATSRVVSHRD